MTLQEAIQRLASTGKNYPLLCEVKEVNGTTVDVEPIGEPEFIDVRINAEIDAPEGVKIIPAVGSKVFIIPINQVTGIVVLASTLTLWGCKIATSQFTQDEQGFLIKKGDDTLREALELIIEAVQQIVVIQGQGPNLPKLTEALTKVQNVLK